MTQMPQITVGADPELFLRDKETGQFVTAHGVIPGTKAEPFKVDKGAVQVDGMAVEFNIDPATGPDQFASNIKTVKRQLSQMLPKNLELVCQPTVLFDQAYFDSCPDVAKELGCEPDFNAYTGLANVKPATDKPMRTAAGHVHIGWGKNIDVNDPDHFADCVEVVKQLDFYVGVPSLMWDSDQERRSLYGRAGAFRVKHYGVEYRTPSCMWTNHVILQNFVWNAAYGAISDLWSGRVARKSLGEMWAGSIINGDVKFSKSIIDGLSYNIRCLRDYGLVGLWDAFYKPPVKPKKKSVKQSIHDYDFYNDQNAEQIDRDRILRKGAVPVEWVQMNAGVIHDHGDINLAAAPKWAPVARPQVVHRDDFARIINE